MEKIKPEEEKLSVKKKEVVGIIRQKLKLLKEEEPNPLDMADRLLKMPEDELRDIAILISRMQDITPVLQKSKTRLEIEEGEVLYSEGVDNCGKDKVIMAIKSRLNRSVGMNSKDSSSAKKLLLFSDSELFQTVFQLAPVIGLIPGWFRRCMLIYLCSCTQKERYAGTLRALTLDAINIKSLPNMMKKIILETSIYGTTKSAKHTHEIMLALSNIHTFQKKMKKEESTLDKNSILPKIIFKDLFDIFTDSKKGKGHVKFLVNNNKNINSDTKNYFNNVWIDAVFNTKQMHKLIYFIAKENAEFNRSPISIDGYLSRYHNIKKEGMTINELFAKILADFATYIEADFRELEQCCKSTIIKQAREADSRK